MAERHGEHDQTRLKLSHEGAFAPRQALGDLDQVEMVVAPRRRRHADEQPQAKKPVVTCCSQSHGSPMSRVTTSRSTEPVKPTIETPHRIISARFERVERRAI